MAEEEYEMMHFRKENFAKLTRATYVGSTVEPGNKKLFGHYTIVH